MCLATQRGQQTLALNSTMAAALAPLQPALETTLSSLNTELQKNDQAQQQQQLQSGAATPQAMTSRPHRHHSPHHAHLIVHHLYHDHALDHREDYQEEHPARGGVLTPFPLKLHEMLSVVQDHGHAHIVSWQPHGRCFVVHKPRELVELLPRYFKLSKLASFQRQLNLYGFQRLTRGRDRGGYYHELFLRDRQFLAHSIQRIKVKGTGVRARSNPDEEPDFWTMPWVQEEGTCTSTSGDGTSTSTPTANANMATVQQRRQSLPVSNNYYDTRMLTSAFTALPYFQQQQRSLSEAMPTQYSSITAAPNHQQQRQQDDDDDIVYAFGNKTFHYLDPFKSVSKDEKVVQPQMQMLSSPDDQEEILSVDANAFFEDFVFPNNIGSEIEDDVVFGEMLEALIA